jgi:hypothetical protein
MCSRRRHLIAEILDGELRLQPRPAKTARGGGDRTR